MHFFCHLYTHDRNGNVNKYQVLVLVELATRSFTASPKLFLILLFFFFLFFLIFLITFIFYCLLCKLFFCYFSLQGCRDEMLHNLSELDQSCPQFHIEDWSQYANCKHRGFVRYKSMLFYIQYIISKFLPSLVHTVNSDFSL